MKTYKILSKTCDKLLVTLLSKNKMLQPTFSTDADYNIVLENDVVKLEKLKYTDIPNCIIVLELSPSEMFEQAGIKFSLTSFSKAEFTLLQRLHTIKAKNKNVLSVDILINGSERVFVKLFSNKL